MNERAPASRSLIFLIALLATVALTGCLYFLHAAADTPFPPYDIAEVIVAITPGPVATAAIEQLGAWAQRSLKLGGAGFVLLLGAALGAWLANWRRPAWLRLVLLAGAPFGATLLLQALLPGRPALNAAKVVGLAALYVAWAGLILWAAARATRVAAAGTPGEASAPDDRRKFLAALAGGVLGFAAAAVFGADRLNARGVSRPGLAGPLPTPQAAAASPTPSAAAAPVSVAAGTATAAGSVPATATEALAGATMPAGTAASEAAPLALDAPASTPTLAPGTPLPTFQPAPGTRPIITPIEDFYVVDKAVVDPDVDVGQWTLTVKGLVDKALTLTFQDLLALPRVDVYATMECISNEVAGRLIGTTLFSGCQLAAVLARAGMQAEGVEVVVRSLDGYSESLTVDKAKDPQTMLVYGMDGKLLEQAHGYPVRLLNPNHYGMKSPKWISGLEVVAEPYEGYWVRLGWDKEAVVKTTSVIDAPGQIKLGRAGAQLGGIAFAGWRGIEEVAVEIDGGEFRAAVLDRPLSDLTWVRWRYDWGDATAGSHKIAVRATDGIGTDQESLKEPPHPDGASGWHTITLRL